MERRCIAVVMLRERSGLTKMIVVDRASVPLVPGPATSFDSVSHLRACFVQTESHRRLFVWICGHMDLFCLIYGQIC